MEKKELHSKLLNDLHETYLQKNHDYGDSFAETYQKLGIISAVTRITDKVNRLTSLSVKKEQKVTDESMVDTLMDCANYCIMTVMEIMCKYGIDNKELSDEFIASELKKKVERKIKSA